MLVKLSRLVTDGISAEITSIWPSGGGVGGVLSIASTITGLTLAQKMGSALFTGLSLTASLLASIALDQFGLMGFKQHSLSMLRLTGAGLMVTGIWLIAKF